MTVIVVMHQRKVLNGPGRTSVMIDVLVIPIKSAVVPRCVWNTAPEKFMGYCVNDYPRNRRVLNDFSITGLEDLTIESCSLICKGKDIRKLTLSF